MQYFCSENNITEKMKKLLICGLSLLSLMACKRLTVDEQRAQDCREFTEKQCPKQIDACTTIDSMAYDAPTRTLTYYYTLKDMLDDEGLTTSGMMEDFSENTLAKLRDDLSLKKEKEDSVTFCYRYFSAKTGKELLSMSFGRKDYTGKFVRRSFNYRETRNMRELTQKTCPLVVDEFTTLDSLTYDSLTRTKAYFYTLKGQLDEDSLFRDTRFMVESLRQQVAVNILTNKEEDVRVERDVEKINFRIVYYSTKHKRIRIDETLTPEYIEQAKRGM